MIPIVISSSGKLPKDLEKNDKKNWKSKEESRRTKLQDC